MRFYALLLVSCAFLAVSGDEAISCLTPNFETAQCTSLFSCPVLLKSLGTLKHSAIEFVQKSTCTEYSPPGDLKVCCGTLGNFKELINPTPVVEGGFHKTPLGKIEGPKHYAASAQEVYHRYVKEQLLPSREYCGLQDQENATALDEFPWLVHLVLKGHELQGKFEYLNELMDRCSGVLVNWQYILTSKYCGTYAKFAHLGQYGAGENITCMKNSKLPECEEPFYDVEVEEVIQREKGKAAWHDFSLLRLARSLTFSDFVKPICLPFNISRSAQEQPSLMFTSWGTPGQNITFKKKIAYKETSMDECNRFDARNLKGAAGRVNLLCLAQEGYNQEEACNGDEGGPLAFAHQNQWFLEALVTSVYSQTGLCSSGEPLAGIKVTPEVLNWIVDNMRP